MNNRLRLLAFGIGALAAACAMAADVAPSGFLVRYELVIGAPAATVYESLLRVGSWWSEKHTYSGDSRNLSIDARAGGCFCESWRTARWSTCASSISRRTRFFA